MYSESRILRSSGYLPPPSPPTEKATARQDQAGKSSTGDGAGDGDVAFNLDIIDAQIKEVYVISFCKAYLIDARSQRPEVDAIGCPRIGVCTGVRPRTVQNTDDIGGIVGERIGPAFQDIDFGILVEKSGVEITTVVKRTNCIIIGK